MRLASDSPCMTREEFRDVFIMLGFACAVANAALVGLIVCLARH